MSYYRIDYTSDGEARTVIIEADEEQAAIRNAIGVLTYEFDDDYNPTVSNLSVRFAYPGEEDEHDHIHRDVAEMEQKLAAIRAEIASKRERGVL